MLGETPADRKAALGRLAARYDGPLAGTLHAALSSDRPTVRVPAYAILSSLGSIASVSTKGWDGLSVETQSDADEAAAGVNRLLRQCPPRTDASAGYESVARDVISLCTRIMERYPGHGPAVAAAIHAYIILGRCAEAGPLLRTLRVGGREEALGRLLDDLAQGGRLDEFGQVVIASRGL